MTTTVTINVDGRPHEVHHRSLTGRHIKDLAHQHNGSVFRVNGNHLHPVPDDQAFEIYGGERFVIEERRREEHHQCPITFEVDATPCETLKHELTGTEIKALARKPPANTLYLIEKRGGHPFRSEIGDTETVHVHHGTEFVTSPPVGKTS